MSETKRPDLDALEARYRDSGTTDPRSGVMRCPIGEVDVVELVAYARDLENRNTELADLLSEFPVCHGTYLGGSSSHEIWTNDCGKIATWIDDDWRPGGDWWCGVCDEHRSQKPEFETHYKHEAPWAENVRSRSCGLKTVVNECIQRALRAEAELNRIRYPRKHVQSHDNVRILYTNYRGETELRTIEPISLYFGEHERHSGPQWLLDAWCFERGSTRTFAMKDIHWWGSIEMKTSMRCAHCGCREDSPAASAPCPDQKPHRFLPT